MAPLLIALAVAACARHEAASYVIDPATGQPVPVVQQYSPQQYGYAQYGYAQAAPASQAQGRGLYNSRPAYAAPSYGYGQAYQSPPAQQYGQASGRGLFGTQHGSSGRGLFSAQPGYAQPQYVQQPYAQQSYAQQPYPQRSYVLQYHAPAAAAGSYRAAPYGYGYGYAYAPSNYEQRYTLDSGDKLRVVVFGQQGISGTYPVDAGGNITLPLAGTIPARHFTTRQVAKQITDKLKQGYVRDPHVTVTIDAYRPFFILGEVTTPGQYPYVPNMTVENAVAVAGGFAPRAQKQNVELTRIANGRRFTSDVPLNTPMRPGDTVVVKERWF